jgi:8-hydroxy-5-deazaflavin:NADPH oxidoreductase
MRIGIIGAGYVGRAIAGLSVKCGHEVIFSNSRGPETLFTTVFAIGGGKAGTVNEAVAFGDIVVVGIPLKNYRSIPVRPLAGKIVVDANNYYPARDGNITELDSKTSTSSELLAAHLPDSTIVKAFNAITMADLEKDGLPPGSPGRRALPLAGDEPIAKKIIADLYDQFGFDSVDAGPLSEGWRFETGTPVYCVRFDVTGMREVLASTSR